MKYNTKKTLSYYLRAASHYPFSGLSLVLAAISSTVATSIIPLYFKDLFDVLSAGAPSDSAVSRLFGILAMIIGLSLLEWLFWRLATWAAIYFQNHVIIDLSNSCFAYLHRHSVTFFNNNFAGSLVKRVKWFSGAFENIADAIVWRIVPLVVNIIMIITILSFRNRLLAGAVGLWIAFFLTVNWIFTKYKLRYDIARSAAETSITGLLADTIGNQSSVKLFNGYWRELKRFAASAAKLGEARRLTWSLDMYFEAVQGLLTLVLEVGIFYLAIRLWQQGLVTVGDFVLLQSYVLTIIMRVWDFGKTVRQIYERLADAEEMTIILETPHEIQDLPAAKSLKVPAGRIEFKNVDFAYHQTRKVLKKFNLIIQPHERLALIGPSGAGKSTVVRLLLRQHDLTAGEILIDGQNISEVTQESLWQNISWVPQDPILFHRTLKENIRYGRPSATNAEVLAAARAAHCHEFIKNFPEGYDTFVGERGVKLSGGERQRVAIARAILRNAPILILDEATSSLDSESEGLIQDALNKLMVNKTVIVIAHRLSTIRKMDRIIVVDRGGIIEEGAHDDLTGKADGLYSRLWRMQAGGFLK
ncbi:MAG: ABC transporter ATP-binding protein [Patescibacteria group bacterium]|jgi:ATP-binding cassette subfamily B protein